MTRLKYKMNDDGSVAIYQEGDSPSESTETIAIDITGALEELQQAIDNVRVANGIYTEDEALAFIITEALERAINHDSDV